MRKCVSSANTGTTTSKRRDIIFTEGGIPSQLGDHENYLVVYVFGLILKSDVEFMSIANGHMSYF